MNSYDISINFNTKSYDKLFLELLEVADRLLNLSGKFALTVFFLGIFESQYGDTSLEVASRSLNYLLNCTKISLKGIEVASISLRKGIKTTASDGNKNLLTNATQGHEECHSLKH